MLISPEVSPTQDVNPDHQLMIEGKRTRKSKPPPIIISEVKDYDSIREKLINELSLTFKTVMLNDGQIKLQVEDTDDYRKTTKYLNMGNYFWHSYEDKQSKPIQVMARKLRPSCKPEKIINDLRTKCFKISNVVNILRRGEKKQLPLFMLTFKNGEYIKKNFEIKKILGMEI